MVACGPSIMAEDTVLPLSSEEFTPVHTAVPSYPTTFLNTAMMQWSQGSRRSKLPRREILDLDKQETWRRRAALEGVRPSGIPSSQTQEATRFGQSPWDLVQPVITTTHQSPRALFHLP